MPQISKELVKDLIATLDAYGCGAHHPDLLPLLDHPEGEPVGILKVWIDGSYSCGVKDCHDEDIPEGVYFIGNTHPAPFTPITADMVTDEMLDYIAEAGKHFDDTGLIVDGGYKVAVAVIYNVVGKYMGAKK